MKSRHQTRRLIVPLLRPSSWLSPNDIKPLPKHEIDAYLKSTTKKTDGKLYAAYGLAADPEEFISEQNELRQHGGVVDEAEDEDQLAEDDEEDEEPEAKSGNKRKKIPADQKPAKKEPASKKAKTEKAPSKRVSAPSGSLITWVSELI